MASALFFFIGEALQGPSGLRMPYKGKKVTSCFCPKTDVAFFKSLRLHSVACRGQGSPLTASLDLRKPSRPNQSLAPWFLNTQISKSTGSKSMTITGPLYSAPLWLRRMGRVAFWSSCTLQEIIGFLGLTLEAVWRKLGWGK